MKIKTLRDQLGKYDDDDEVWISIDAEGNEFKDIENVHTAVEDEIGTLAGAIIFPL